MKKLFFYIAATMVSLSLTGCMDLGPGEREVMEAHENEALALLAKLLPA